METETNSMQTKSRNQKKDEMSQRSIYFFKASKAKEWKDEFLKQRPLLWTELAPIAILSLTNPLFHSAGGFCALN